MARPVDNLRVMAIYAEIVRRPGLRPAHVARRLGMTRAAVTRTLPILERYGLLLCEQNHQLYPAPHLKNNAKS